MKAFVAAVVGFAGASLYHSRSDAQAWGCRGGSHAFSHRFYQPYTLMDVEEVSHNTKHFRFALGSESTPLDLPVACCITLRYVDEKGEEVARPYTPINLVTDKGHFDLVVKCYPNSKMGSHLFGMKIGDSIEAKGPWHTFDVKPSQYKHIGMIAGGTGLTPMFQTINNVLHAPGNTTKISLLFANKTEGDILLGSELESLAKEFPDNFTTYHCLHHPPEGWTGFRGYIDKKMIEETMPKPAGRGESMIMVCGPPSFMESISGPKGPLRFPFKQGPLQGYLKEMGYTEKEVNKF